MSSPTPNGIFLGYAAGYPNDLKLRCLYLF